MNSFQDIWQGNKWQVSKEVSNNSKDSQLVLVFGQRELLKKSDWQEHLKLKYPKAQIVGCSSAGNIQGATVSDQTIVSTAIWFEKTEIKVELESIS